MLYRVGLIITFFFLQSVQGKSIPECIDKAAGLCGISTVALRHVFDYNEIVSAVECSHVRPKIDCLGREYSTCMDNDIETQLKVRRMNKMILADRCPDNNEVTAETTTAVETSTLEKIIETSHEPIVARMKREITDLQCISEIDKSLSSIMKVCFNEALDENAISVFNITKIEVRCAFFLSYAYCSAGKVVQVCGKDAKKPFLMGMFIQFEKQDPEAMTAEKCVDAKKEACKDNPSGDDEKLHF